MSVFQESDIEFDFSAALRSRQHDKLAGVFDGVDFIIEETGREIWLEVSSWERSTTPPRRRGGQARAFLARMRLTTTGRTYFREELRAKFTGTVAHLCLTGDHPHHAILYVCLLESRHMDSALMLHTTIRLRNLVCRAGWRIPVKAAVVNLDEWNSRFPQYPAKPV